MPTEHRVGHVWTTISMSEIAMANRFNPPFFEDKYVEVEQRLKELKAVLLGQYIPELLPDGSKGITYGQVGPRKLSARGGVRYLQVINIRETGIDFAIKPDRIAENSYNDPPRSRIAPGDILFTNNAFRGTDTLIGRCVVVVQDYGKTNISQHIDRIRVVGINPYYVCCFLKSEYGSRQIQRYMHGVDSSGISFGRIRAMLIPELSQSVQNEIEDQYVRMSTCHDRAMNIKERILQEEGIDPGKYGEAINALADKRAPYRKTMTEAKQRLDHLLAQLVAVIEGRQNKLKPFPE